MNIQKVMYSILFVFFFLLFNCKTTELIEKEISLENANDGNTAYSSSPNERVFEMNESESKIYFSNEPILSKTSPKTNLTYFTNKDKIYGIAFFEKPLKLKKIGVSISFRLDSQSGFYSVWEKKQIELGLTKNEKSFIFEIIPDVKNPISNAGLEHLEIFKKLKRGLSKIKVEVYELDHSNKTNECIGEFELFTQDNNLYTNMLEELQKNLISKAIFPDPIKKDPMLENEMLTTLKLVNNKQETPVRISITDLDWSIYKKDNKILKRSINTRVGFKLDKGKCIVKHVSFTQNYFNGKYKSALEIDESHLEFEISCENL